MEKPRPNEDQLVEPTAPDAPGPVNEYFSIPLSNLRLDTVTGFNLHLRNSSGSYVLYRGADLTFTEEHKEKLRQSKVRKLYISSDDRAQYLRYMEANLAHLLADESTPPSKKAKVLYDSASQLVEDIFANPTIGENLKRAYGLVDNTVGYLLKGPEYLTSMLSILSYDYGIYTHCVNVCVFGVALARRLGLSSMELRQLGAGLLLHDVGKSQIDPEILLKSGVLTADEWKLVQQHPEIGVKLLREAGQADETVLTVILQHHEKCSGKGYPNSLGEGDIHFFSKIAALVDVFDALTTRRPYKGAVESFPAIRIMQTDMRNSFNPELLRELILMMHGSANEMSAREEAA